MFSILDLWLCSAQHDLAATQKGRVTSEVSALLAPEYPKSGPRRSSVFSIKEANMRKLLCTIATSAILCCFLAQNATAQHDPSHAVFLKFSDLKWEKTPDGLQDIAILHVNPVSKAMELIIRAPKGFHVPRHWHSANETLTIISGTFTMKHDGSDEKVVLNTGSYSYMPAKMVHEAWAGDEGAVFFITVDGAWDLNWVE
jgi:quercetin dioxygenase-like cupin family protein